MPRPLDLFTPQPDNTISTVGDLGIRITQDSSGAQVSRIGIPGSEADWGPETATLDANGETIIANPESVGGTTASSGIIRSIDDQNVNVVYAWTGDGTQPTTVSEAESNGEVVVERAPGTQGFTEVVIEAINTKSDNCVVFVENDTASENQIQYTLNFT